MYHTQNLTTWKYQRLFFTTQRFQGKSKPVYKRCHLLKVNKKESITKYIVLMKEMQWLQIQHKASVNQYDLLS